MFHIPFCKRQLNRTSNFFYEFSFRSHNILSLGWLRPSVGGKLSWTPRIHRKCVLGHMLSSLLLGMFHQQQKKKSYSIKDWHVSWSLVLRGLIKKIRFQKIKFCLELFLAKKDTERLLTALWKDAEFFKIGG